MEGGGKAAAAGTDGNSGEMFSCAQFLLMLSSASNSHFTKHCGIFSNIFLYILYILYLHSFGTYDPYRSPVCRKHGMQSKSNSNRYRCSLAVRRPAESANTDQNSETWRWFGVHFRVVVLVHGPNEASLANALTK